MRSRKRTGGRKYRAQRWGQEPEVLDWWDWVRVLGLVVAGLWVLGWLAGCEGGGLSGVVLGAGGKGRDKWGRWVGEGPSGLLRGTLAQGWGRAFWWPCELWCGQARCDTCGGFLLYPYHKKIVTWQANTYCWSCWMIFHEKRLKFAQLKPHH